MRLDGYKVICEVFNSRKDEKELGSFKITELSIYRGDKLVTKRYLTAKLVLTNRKMVIDNLSRPSLIPLISGKIEIARTILHDIKAIWKPVSAFEIPYQFLKSMEYDKSEKELKIETFIDKASVFIKFFRPDQSSKEVISILDKLDVVE